MARPEDVEGLSAVEIEDRYALPNLPSCLSDVRVPAGVTIRSGVVRRYPDLGVGGAVQFEVLERLPETAYTTKRLVS